jgi:uridylate kinase
MFFWKKGYLSHIDVKNVFLTPNPSMEIEDLQYEEMIEHILIKSGGQAFQSDIVKETMLSKSKISIVISEMKHKGRIIKIRRGKENLIRLVNK